MERAEAEIVAWQNSALSFDNHFVHPDAIETEVTMELVLKSDRSWHSFSSLGRRQILQKKEQRGVSPELD
jgi:hypothetical protein